jgi:hypothetical protein
MRTYVALLTLVAAAIAVTTGVGPTVDGTVGRRAAASGGFESLPAPQRLLDTRPGQTTADGQFAGGGRRAAGSTLELTVAGRAGLPPGLTSVVLNVTVTEPTGRGFVTVYPCGSGQDRPTASNLNYGPGQTVPNAVIVKVGDGGRVCLYTLREAHLIVDASGHFAADAFRALPAPRRVLDTRAGQRTADNLFAGGGIRGEGTTLELPVAGRAGIAPDASSVVLNITVDAPLGQGFLTVYPCGTQGRPTASNLNFRPGQTVANLVITKVGTGGRVCIYTHRSTHVVVDASGELPATTFVPLTSPQRLLDTRPGSETADGGFMRFGAQPAGSTLQLRVNGRAGIPSDASAVVLNVTAVDPASRGFVTAHPRGSGRPTASNLNHAPGFTVPNAVIARVGQGGDICLFTSGATHLVADVAGWLTGPPPPTTGGHCPTVTPALSDADAVNQLVVRAPLHRVVGTDRIAVWACDVPGGPVSVDPVAVAAWANSEVSPWFTEASGGRYAASFEAHSERRVAASNARGCLDRARERTGAPFTNALVVDTSDGRGGFASPGSYPVDPSRNTEVLARAPMDSRRGAYVGGGSIVTRANPSVLVHEIGHTLHWPHSNVNQSNEYDNPLDVMSGDPVPLSQFLGNESAFCTAPNSSGGITYWGCIAQHTLAFNRLAAHWTTGGQVGIHRSGRANYILDRPTGPGVQLVAFPDPAQPRSMLTIEARPALGRDRHTMVAGVAVHVIDQVLPQSSFSTSRRQKQAAGGSDSYGHVVPVGQTATMHGVQISVLGTAGDGYQVTVQGTFRRPADNYFTESAVTPVPCGAFDDPAAAFERGCWK